MTTPPSSGSHPRPGQPTPNPRGYPVPMTPGRAQPGAAYAQPHSTRADGSGPDAPYGRDRATGEPLSDKSALTAGLLQIFVGMFGVGRFYLGSNTVAIIQLSLTIAGFVSTIFLIGLFILPVVWIWTVIDGVMMITGSVTDAQGRKLRPAN